MFSDAVINTTEKRTVGHFHLRTQNPCNQIEQEVVAVHQRIKEFSEKVRSGEITGLTGKKINTILAIGIGGSYLGPEFVYEALRFDPVCQAASAGLKLKFLANVDPIDFNRAVELFDVEKTLFVIVSKTFTTAETILNANTCRDWILNKYPKIEQTSPE